MCFSDASNCPACSNTCFSIGTNISCECPLTSDECLHYFNSCEVYCQNGICKNETCFCNSGFIGQYCDMQLCGEQICMNNTTCGLKNGISTCQCLPGYAGNNCTGKIIHNLQRTAVFMLLKTAAVCDPPCKNDGECIAPNECSCPETYDGIDCSESK